MDFKMKKTKLGVIGCGMISGAYLKAASRFRNIEIVAGSDIVPGRAAAKRDEFKEFGYSEETFRAYDANPDGTNAELLIMVMSAPHSNSITPVRWVVTLIG